MMNWNVLNHIDIVTMMCVYACLLMLFAIQEVNVRVSNEDCEPVLICGRVSNPSAHNTDTFKGERVGCLRGFLQTSCEKINS